MSSFIYIHLATIFFLQSAPLIWLLLFLSLAFMCGWILFWIWCSHKVRKRPLKWMASNSKTVASQSTEVGFYLLCFSHCGHPLIWTMPLQGSNAWNILSMVGAGPSQHCSSIVHSICLNRMRRDWHKDRVLVTVLGCWALNAFAPHPSVFLPPPSLSIYIWSLLFHFNVPFWSQYM